MERLNITGELEEYLKREEKVDFFPMGEILFTVTMAKKLELPIVFHNT